MSDAPEGPEALRGGKERGDPALDGATPTGRQGVGSSDKNDPDDSSNTQLQAQEGGAAGGGGQAGG